MQIRVNGESRQFENASMTLPEFLVASQVESPDVVTVQLNGSFVDRGNFQSTLIKDGDEIDFLYFLGGGVGG